MEAAGFSFSSLERGEHGWEVSSESIHRSCGAARLLYASSDSDAPTEINDVIDTATGGTQFDPQDANGTDGWLELGATRQGCQISVNNTETAFDIDQVQGAVGTAPDTWECFVDTRIAEMTLEHLVFAWEGVDITTNVSPSPSERHTAFAGATTYTERKLAIVDVPFGS